MDTLVRDLVHPLEGEIEALRRILLGASPKIGEGIKWNSPSYRTGDWFATLHIPRSKDRILLILHSGAKAQGVVLKGRIADPAGLLKWLAPNRCVVTFEDARDVTRMRAALPGIVRAWIKLLEGS